MKLLELLTLPVLNSTQVVAGHQGLEREVRWVHISDLPDMVPWVQGGQFVLTAGYAWPRDEEQQRALIRTLAGLNIAGIGLAIPHFFDHFSTAAREEADSVQLPLLEIPWSIPFSRITEDFHQIILAEQYRIIARSEEIHRALTRASLKAGGLQDLAVTLSDLIQRTVVFADMEGKVLCIQEIHSGLIFNFEELFDHVEQSGHLSTIRTKNEPLHIATLQVGHHSECILCPIRLQEELVGLVWIIEGEQGFNELDKRAAEHAAIVAALHIAHQRELATLEARFGYTFLDSLLEGRFEATPSALERANLLGFNPEESYRIGLIILNESLPLSKEGFLRRERMIEKLRQRMKFLTIAPLISVSINQIPFLLPERCNGERIWNALKQDQVALAFGLPYAGIEGVEKSYREVLSLLPSILDHKLYYYETQLMPRVLLGEKEAQQAFVEALFGHFKQQRNGEILIETLLAWSKAGFHASATAEQLSIHPKTLQYRLTKAAEIGMLDLNDPETRFKLQLAGQLLSLWDKK